MEAAWGIVAHYYTKSQRLFGIYRVVFVDGYWYELFQHPAGGITSERLGAVQDRAVALGIVPRAVFYEDDSAGPLTGKRLSTRKPPRD